MEKEELTQEEKREQRLQYLRDYNKKYRAENKNKLSKQQKIIYANGKKNELIKKTIENINKLLIVLNEMEREQFEKNIIESINKPIETN